jgi:hypothetical protein
MHRVYVRNVSVVDLDNEAMSTGRELHLCASITGLWPAYNGGYGIAGKLACLPGASPLFQWDSCELFDGN